jgi:hypothetical protein
MTVAHRNTPTTFTNTWPTDATSTVLSAVSGIQDGDLLVAIIWLGDDGGARTATPPAGWSTYNNSLITYDDSGYYVNIGVFYKVASSESGSYTFTHSSAVNEGYLCALTGVDTSDPINPTATSDTGTGQTSTAPTITTPRDGSLVIFCSGHWDAAACSPPTGSTPTFTERYDPGGSGGIAYLADGPLTTAGATGAKSHTNGNSGSGPWGAGLISIQAAAADITLSPTQDGVHKLFGTKQELQRNRTKTGKNSAHALSGTHPTLTTPTEQTLFIQGAGHALSTVETSILLTPILEQEGFRWRNDDNDEANATWRQNQDVDDSISKSVNIRLRLIVNATGDPTSKQYELQYKRTSDPATKWRTLAA